MTYHLAQVNIARFMQPVDHPANADFVAALDHVNALAEASPGFIWRLKGEGNNATDLKPSDADPNLAINMSVWTSVDALAAFVYRNFDHRAVMRRRREWFEETKTYMALWWTLEGVLPTVEDALAKLALLERDGPCAAVFTFRHVFPPPTGGPVAPALDECA